MRKTGLGAFFIFFLGLIQPGAAQANPASRDQITAAEIVSKNVQAAGGAEALARIKTVSFSAGPARYTASADGRLKVRSALEEPAAYEVLIVSGTSVKRNTLNRISDLSGIERGRWICLARLAGGLFTLKNFGPGLTYEGARTLGPERHHILSTEVEGLRASFSVDASDFLVKRMVLSGVDAAGEAWEESTEFGSAEAVEGIRLPTGLYVSQVGVGGTYSPGPRPLTGFQINPDLTSDFFDDIKVNAGQTEVSPGRLDGNVLFSQFDEEDLFVRIFTNWSEEDIRAAGLKNGDVLILTSGGAEFESKLYILENQVDDSTVYSPGNSLFTHTPTRFPAFYAQFNTLSPKEKFDDFKARLKVLAPIQARIKDQRRSS